MNGERENSAIWVAEQNAARLERSNKRLFILNVVLVILLMATFVTFFYYESQFTNEYQIIKAEQQSDGDSSNYVIGGNYGGEAESNDSN